MASYLVAKLPTDATIFSFGTSLISKSRSSNNSSSMSKSSSSSKGSAFSSDASASSSSSSLSSLTNGVFFSSPGSSFNDNSSINNFGPSSPNASASSASSISGMITETPEAFSFNELPVAIFESMGAGLFKSHSCFTASSVSSLTNSGAFFLGIKKSKLGTLKLGLNLHMI